MANGQYGVDANGNQVTEQNSATRILALILGAAQGIKGYGFDANGNQMTEQNSATRIIALILGAVQ